MEVVSSFLLGFVVMWFALRLNFMKPYNTEIKESMIEMANNFSSNRKICKELQNYSMSQIKNGNYDYIEVIDTIKRQSNDKTRT